jgi:large subunit ribosomal protein L29
VKGQDLKEMTDEELRQKYSDAQDEIVNLRIQKSTGEIEQPLRLRTLRRDIARILTTMKQRTLS